MVCGLRDVVAVKGKASRLVVDWRRSNMLDTRFCADALDGVDDRFMDQGTWSRSTEFASSVPPQPAVDAVKLLDTAVRRQHDHSIVSCTLTFKQSTVSRPRR